MATEVDRRRRPARRWPTVVLAALVALLAVVGVGALGATGAAGEIYTAPPPGVPVAAPAPAHDPAKPTVAIVLGPEGTNVADSLPPYEVFAATGAFNVYTVAPDRRPVPMTGGLDHVPQLDFAALDALLPGPPDVIVVPQLHAMDSAGVATVIRWLQRQRAEGRPLLLSVCVGAWVLADAGLLDGRPATSHWLGLIGLRRDHPEVRWQDGVRYVDDGDVITSSGVLRGVDGSLRVIERLRGPEVAAGAARAIGWPDYVPGTAAAIPRSSPAPPDVAGLLSAAYRADRPTTGVLLTDGVGEVELASALRPYTELSYLARPLTLSADGRPVRSRHGLVFVPRGDLVGAAGRLDRLLVPGAQAARDARVPVLPGGPPPTYLHDRPGFAFDGALRDIAATDDVATARWVAKTLQYPGPEPTLTGARWPWALTVRAVLIAAVAAGAVVLAVRLRRRRGPPPAAPRR
ncbi:DJ-1/PfpI family protein [Actinomycetospora sp. CA-101289]|uniref:DJ-1/PfpI family protein n=1 Tax=Actinomycetospora sp. CA-101289 TaxID=3239893 RepID=UPI003D9716B2